MPRSENITGIHEILFDSFDNIKKAFKKMETKRLTLFFHRTDDGFLSRVIFSCIERHLLSLNGRKGMQ